jgi:hypothetical protein
MKSTRRPSVKIARPPTFTEYDVNTQTVSGKFNIMPTDGLLLFPEDVEKDDYGSKGKVLSWLMELILERAADHRSGDRGR